MQLSITKQDLNQLIMVGDKVLVKPKNPQRQTKAGLFLPPTVQQGEKVQSGYVVKTGPGFPLPSLTDESEAWRKKDEEVRYLPLQAQEGDLAVFFQNATCEIRFNDEIYFIIPHSAILMLIRDEGLFE
ncbi:MAG: co-chaperone GroES family protein [Tannerellaceae bacterium]|jgi:co-chaperonin GroES (HSP10)|nr:co-chaperone GroES family protein [Tannerellaceae bacterium]